MTEAFGWVSDVCIFAISRTYATNKQLLEKAPSRANRWSWRESSRFAPDKLELFNFKNPNAPRLTIIFPTKPRQSQTVHGGSQTNRGAMIASL
ncbi:hypothetical protein BO94DRAFT_267582 [Aspergillus sclerotioniger CBS 115572]|uniref:Uncharacterized protein n=1 Tax=Aspergillus sclerotioniger CBS 115572 TaxID=1450535 RepID=A0A317VCS6_9EURO|nr:hypothetical protein BO94DRAFT_267582 [Aspergillus sclerotioniger CBS 115572]PWY70877.1 hypothetical protein BO94DRAFT_267582 [Aspergillus sclerotioniger CBS 115572]